MVNIIFRCVIVILMHAWVVYSGSSGSRDYSEYPCTNTVVHHPTGGINNSVEATSTNVLPQEPLIIKLVNGRQFVPGDVLKCQIREGSDSFSHYATYVGHDEVVHMTTKKILKSKIVWQSSSGSESPNVMIFTSASLSSSKPPGYYLETDSCNGFLYKASEFNSVKRLSTCDEQCTVKLALSYVGTKTCYDINKCNPEHWAAFFFFGGMDNSFSTQTSTMSSGRCFDKRQ